MQKIFVLRGGALGDFIVTLPALALLRQRWPAARIELVGNATAAALAVNRGLLDAAHSQHEARWGALFSADALPDALARWLSDFDLVVNYWPDPDATLRLHFPLHTRQTFLTADALPTLAPAAAHYCEPLRPLGLKTSDYFYRIEVGRVAVPAVASREGWVPNPPTQDSRSLPGVADDNTSHPIAIHPGSGSPRKNWPADRWFELISKLNSPVRLILGEAEERWSRLAPTRLGSHVRILAQLPLETLIAELSSCRLFLGHDSGISHLAAACGVPCVLLFGPTDPKIWAPPAPHVRVLQSRSDLAAISVEEVSSAVAAVIDRRHSFS